MKIISSANVRFACLALAAAIAPALAQSAHVLVPADKVQWGPAPPVLPAGAQISVLEGHFAWTASPTVVQINLEGPFDIFYINPSDDPQTKLSTR
jgi:hypothetical protein